VDAAFGTDEMAYIRDVCGVGLVLHDRPLPIDSRPLWDGPGGMTLSTLAPAAAALPASILPTTEVCRFTSGSTGQPNCLEFSGSAVHNAALGWREASGNAADDRVLCFAGLSNGLAFNTSLLAVFLSGGSLWLTSGLPSAGLVVRLLETVRPTRLVGFPTIFESLLRRRNLPSMSGLRSAISSGAPLRQEVADELREAHGLAVCNYYGIAETGPLTYDPAPDVNGGQGYPLPDVEIVVRDPDEEGVGTICVSSPSMASRYLNAPARLSARIDASGRFRTEDLGVVDQGRLHLRGRVGGAINIAGRKIDPAEIRDVLMRADGVTDVCVVSLVKVNGDPCLAAAVVADRDVEAGELRAHCLRHLAGYKVPELVRVVTQLPLNTIGKPRVEAVRHLLADSLAGASRR
jgi:acyl-CoA synthetase (AMP-forming)/AMP-acid ligase II